MRMVDLIQKKRDGYELTKEEIQFIIDGYVDETIPDYQMSAWAMAVFFKDMNSTERSNLTMSILNSGETIDLSEINGIKVDKHSTGGVGDKTSLVLAPLVASLDIPFAKMSGRGLGHTGGTLDKLESIEGFNIYLDSKTFIEQVNEHNIAIIGQTANLTPADKKLYSLRDVTATVNSVPLIASSIMSKKMASGADKIVLDVKVGNGAFMNTIEDANELAHAMVDIGNSLNRETVAFITNMDQPLGNAVGNSLEVIEAIETLKGNGPKDLLELVLDIGSHMVVLGGVTSSLDEARELLIENINNGKALQKLKDLVRLQSGNEEYITNTDLFPKASEIIEVKAWQDGYVESIEALEIGIAAMMLGAGRETKEDDIDLAVGIVLNKKVSDKVNNGDTLAYIHTNGKNTESVIEKVKDSIKLTDKDVLEPTLIYDIVT